MKRWVLAAALGAAAAAVLDAVLPAGSEPALRATLVALPIVVALLEALRRDLGARSASAAERLLAAAWLVAALSVGRLALPAVEPALLAAGILLLGARVAALLPALARRVARRGAAAWPAFAALAFAAGLALLPWTVARSEPIGDEPYFLLLAESLASDGDVDLADEYAQGVARGFLGRDLGPQPGDPVGSGGELYSRHESMLPFLLVPFWLAGGVLGVRLAMLALWALAAASMLRLAFAFGLSSRQSLRAALVATFAPPFVLYAHAIWVEVPAALATALAIELWLDARGRGEPLAGRRLLGFVAALAALPLLKLRLLGIALPLSLLALVGGARRRGPRLAAIATIALVGAAVLVRNLEIAGNALRVYEARDLALHEVPPARFLLAADGLVFDVAFGLLAWAPVWLLALPGIAGALRRLRGYALAGAACAPYLLVVASRREWYGGWSPPFRYGVVVLPLLAVGFASLGRSRSTPAVRALGAALLALSALAALAAWIEPGWVPSFADGRSRLLDLAAAPFAADFARFFPSALRPRTATWLVPAVALVLMALAQRIRRRSRPAAAAWGVALLLVAGGALVFAAHRVPTRVVELEDPWIAKPVGTLYPSRWTFDRTRYSGGWTLATGMRAVIVPVAGGGTAVARVRYRGLSTSTGSIALELYAGAEPLARWVVEPGADWAWQATPSFPWAEDGTLHLLVRGIGRGTRRGALVVDKVELAWR